MSNIKWFLFVWKYPSFLKDNFAGSIFGWLFLLLHWVCHLTAFWIPLFLWESNRKSYWGSLVYDMSFFLLLLSEFSLSSAFNIFTTMCIGADPSIYPTWNSLLLICIDWSFSSNLGNLKPLFFWICFLSLSLCLSF